MSLVRYLNLYKKELAGPGSIWPVGLQLASFLHCPHVLPYNLRAPCIPLAAHFGRIRQDPPRIHAGSMQDPARIHTTSEQALLGVNTDSWLSSLEIATQ